MSLCRGDPTCSLLCSKEHKQAPHVVFRRPPRGNVQLSGEDECSHNKTRRMPVTENDDSYIPASVEPFVIGYECRHNSYDAPASLPLLFSDPKQIISFVEEALARAACLSDVPVVAEWMSTRMAEEACDDELVMKIEAYLSHVCFREYRKTQSETRFLQAASLIGHLFRLGAITSLHILSIAETLVFTIDQPMRIQGIMALFASAGSSLCRVECVTRTTEVAAKLKEASLARPRNELLRRYSREIESFVDVWTKVEEYKALWE